MARTKRRVMVMEGKPKRIGDNTITVRKVPKRRKRFVLIVETGVDNASEAGK